MKILIATASKYGGTKALAERMAPRFGGEVTLLSLTKHTVADLSPFDVVILGSSIYMGKARKAATAFAKTYQRELHKKRLGLFLCCIQDQEKARMQQMAATYPEDLLRHASALGTLGATVDFEKLTILDAFIMKLVAGDIIKKSGKKAISTITEEGINQFIQLVMKDLWA